MQHNWLVPLFVVISCFSCFALSVSYHMSGKILSYWVCHTVAVLAEWKPPVYNNANGIRLITASTRRNSPNVNIIDQEYWFLSLIMKPDLVLDKNLLEQWRWWLIHVRTNKCRGFNRLQSLDSKIHHNNLINNILAKVSAPWLCFKHMVWSFCTMWLMLV
jgi:hypothetical protein